MTGTSVATREPKAHLVTGGSVAAIIPRSVEEIFRLAGAIQASGLAPQSLSSVEKITVAIMAGAELGLPPFQSLQSFAVINNRPTIWGDGMLAVLLTNGFKVDEWFDSDDAPTKAICKVTRPDNGQVIERTFSLDDAKKANLLGKSGPWQTSTKRMLQMRARGFAARDGASDVLRGFQLREEVDDYQPIREVAPAQGTGMRARLAARPVSEADEQGFDADHVSGALPGPPPADAEFSEQHEANGLSEGEPAEASSTALPPEQSTAELSAAAGEAGSNTVEGSAPPHSTADAGTLADRINGFKGRVRGASTTVKLQSFWNASAALRNDIDKADPDEFGTSADLEQFWQERYDAVEAEERGARS